MRRDLLARSEIPPSPLPSPPGGGRGDFGWAVRPPALQHHYGRACASALGRRVEDVRDVVPFCQQAAHFRPPHADALAVDQAHLAKAGLARETQVLLDGGGDVLGEEGVEVERILEGNASQAGGLSVVARVSRAGSTASISPQTQAARKLPSAATSPFGVSTFRPSLTVRSLDQRRRDPDGPRGVSSNWIVTSQEHFGHTVQR
jgi:hypothetical protein